MEHTHVKALVLPVLRRFWLFHAWKEVPPPRPGAQQTWKEAIQAKVTKNFEQQWDKLEAAPEGTLNHRLFKFAQYVLSRVDPSETFLKALPQQADSFSILYPSSLPERLVRRRLRLLAAKAQPFHASRLRVWTAALVPQLPLIPLPLPNVTIYYTIWRIVSNRSASKGAVALADALQLSSDVHRLKLAQQLQQLQQQGVQLKRGSWAEQLVADIDRLQSRAVLQQGSSSTEQQQPAQQEAKHLPMPIFVPDKQLDHLVQPSNRLVTPLPESVVRELEELYKQNRLVEHFRAANRKCLEQSVQ